MNEERDEIILMIDENGEEIEAEYIDTIEYRGSEYVVLLPLDEGADDGDDMDDEEANARDGDDADGDASDSDDDSGNGAADSADGGGACRHSHEDGECDCEEEEVIILRVEYNAEKNEETFVAIDDEAEQEAVFEIFTKRMEEEEDSED